nr:hypothetical protein [Tanacetum cinerariifolium]
MDLLNTLLETCTALTKRVKNLEQDKIAQALEITRLKQRVRKLEKKRKLTVSGLKRLRKVGTTQRVESSADTVMDDQEDASKHGMFRGNPEESQAKVYHIDLEHANKVLITAATTTITAAASITVAAPITATTITAAPSAARRKKGVVIRDPKETATPSTIQAQIEQNEAYARELKAKLDRNISWDDVIEQVKEKGKQDNVVLRYQALKRKPQTVAQARKNMMVYLKNMDGFKMEYFKDMSYDDICPIFKKYLNSNVAFLEKSKEQLEKEESRALKRTSKSLEEKEAKKQKLDEEVKELKKHLQIMPNNDDDVYTEAIPLALKVPIIDYEIHSEKNKPYYKIIRADGSHQLFLSFLS